MEKSLQIVMGNCTAGHRIEIVKNLPRFFIAWGYPRLAGAYRVSDLRGDDVRRAAQPRSAKAQRDWQVSRALLHSVRTEDNDSVHSLSHKQGHAVCAVAPTAWQIGVDMERIVPRDVMRLAAWTCSAQEQHRLAEMKEPSRLLHFYLLWTLKEAFIKADNGVFPRDMARLGLLYDEAGQSKLRAPTGRWHACAWRLEPDWLVTLVWQAPVATQMLPQWYAPSVCSLPTRALLGQWSV